MSHDSLRHVTGEEALEANAAAEELLEIIADFTDRTPAKMVQILTVMICKFHHQACEKDKEEECLDDFFEGCRRTFRANNGVKH